MLLKPNRTSAYISTIFMDSREDLEHLKAIRNMVKNLNRDLKRQKDRDRYDKKGPLQFYVKLQGRLGRNKKGPIADMYRKLWRQGGSVCVSVDDAEYCDVFLYRRYRYR